MTIPASMGPLHLDPLLVSKPWGGRRLERFGRTLPEGQLIGESWDVADLAAGTTTATADPVTRVMAGPVTGRSLQELVDTDRAALLGAAPDLDGRFPLLVKTLDAREHLSVQVHPPAAYVADHPDAHLKTETWVVLDADPGAELLIGFEPGVTVADVRRVLGTRDVLDLMRRVTAFVGAVHHLPAGTIHALGAGVLVAEVQTPSDTTFRVYDWAREYGRTPRELHVDAASRSIELSWEANTTPWLPPPPGTSELVSTPEYRLSRHRLKAGAASFSEGGRVRVLYVVEGVLEAEGFAWPLRPGGVVVLPASWSGRIRASEDCTVLEAAP